jgi:hypothetical protein
MRWASHVTNMGGMRNIYKIFVRKPEGKREFGKPRHKLGDNVRTDLREIGWEVVE